MKDFVLQITISLAKPFKPCYCQALAVKQSVEQILNRVINANGLDLASLR
jgi:hypothetical protein